MLSTPSGADLMTEMPYQERLALLAIRIEELEQENEQLRAAGATLAEVRTLVSTTLHLQGNDPDTGDWFISGLALVEVLNDD